MLAHLNTNLMDGLVCNVETAVDEAAKHNREPDEGADQRLKYVCHPSNDPEGLAE